MRLSRQFERQVERGRPDAREQRDTAALRRQINQARALGDRKGGVFAGRAEQQNSVCAAPAKVVDQFKSGPEVDLSILAPRSDRSGLHAREPIHIEDFTMQVFSLLLWRG